MTTTPTLWRAEQRANTVLTGNQANSQLVKLKDGGFVILWDSNANVGAGSDGGTDIIGQRYDALGARVGGEFLANKSYFSDNEGWSSTGALPNGNVVVVYEDTDANGTAIRFEVLDPTGKRIDFGTVINDPGADTLAYPSVAVAADGSFLVAYDRGNGTTEVVKVTAAGAAGAPVAALTTNGAGVKTGVATLTNGTFVVVAEGHIPSDPDDTAIFVRTISANGTPFGSANYIGDTLTNGEGDYNPAITALAGGGFVVSWTNVDADDDDIQFQVYNVSGSMVGGVKTVAGAGTSDFNDNTTLVALPDGGFVVAYSDEVTEDIKLQRFDAAGATVGTSVTVEDQGVTTDPHLSLTADGRILVSWTVLTSLNDQNVDFAIYDPRDATINGTAASETITARKDGATVFGLGGDDVLLGFAGNDTLNGGTGVDRMTGGAGNDRFFVDNAADLVFESAGGGTDQVIASVTYTLRAGVEVETLSTTGGTTTMNLVGNELAQRVIGNEGTNTLYGNAGNDTMQGFGGNDTLHGGLGSDRLYGGAGDDRFVFTTALNATTNLDTIYDFANVSGNDDRFLLDNAVFTKLTATGALNAAFFKANLTGTAADANDYIVYETDTGKLFYDADGNGAGAAIQFALLTNKATLTAGDFFVV